MTFRPGTWLGPYEIVGPLGAGGMGEVYRARDSRLKREVALKALPDEFSKDVDRLSRFQREAEVLASLSHPHIAAIYGLEEAEGSRFLILELVEGETLAHRLARGPMSVDEALATARQVSEALEAAHGRGIVHRDLKPANIKLTPDGVAKVLDFGLAKVSATEAWGAGDSGFATVMPSAPAALIGTPAYMSPEQVSGKQIDRSSLRRVGVRMRALRNARGQRSLPRRKRGRDRRRRLQSRTGLAAFATGHSARDSAPASTLLAKRPETSTSRHH
jgi:eukaryotic-like serine/threonine-protein kinase